MTINLYKIFLASPGDTKEERKITENVIDEINSTLGEHHNFRAELLTWENNTSPSFGEDGQDVINKDIGLDYDIFIGIMWKRFGTPTKRADSGTEEEFTRAYEKLEKGDDIKIMFYFNSAPLEQENLDLDQFKKVQTFKKKVGELGGYYWTYKSVDEFQREVRKHLTKHLLNISTSKPIENEKVSSDINKPIKSLIPKISEEFNNYLNDPNANFAHSKKDKLSLKDLYVAPDLRNLNISKKDTSYNTDNLDKLTDAIDVDGIKFLFVGNELAGKTTTCKFLFDKYFNQGLLPILLKGAEINNYHSENLIKLLENKISDQYYIPFSFSDFNKNRYLIIIDDFHKSTKGKNKYWHTLIKNLELISDNIIITGSNLMPIENISKQDSFKNFSQYSILEFGPLLRAEIVNKWNSLGIDLREIDKNDILRKNDNAISHIKTIIGKNYIPAFPFYLLSILQAMESGNIQNPNYSIHGFYYELIINESFNRAVKDKKEISLYYNYLTHFSYYLFETEQKEISISDFQSFHDIYCEKHDLSYNLETILNTFEKSNLIVRGNTVFIKENFVYYFFVAKFIANNIHKQEIKEIITKMSIRIFRDEYSSIIMFVTHLSKDDFIINELVKNANSIFDKIEIAKLEDDIKGINELIESVPKQVLEIVDIETKREEQLISQEDEERLDKDFENEKTNYDNFKLSDDVETIDFYARFTLALKTIDILGQITKKHWGEIDGEQKYNLVKSTYNLGLRTLNIYLQYLQNNSKDIIEHIKELVEEKHIKDRFQLKKTVEDTARDFIFRLCFMTTWGITKRVSNSIGYDKLKNSFEKVQKEQPYNSVNLIDLSIKLGYSSIPIDIVTDFKHKMEKNKLSTVLLQNLIIDYIYMFDTDYKTKQQVCSILGISVQEQLKISSTSKVKRK